MKQNCILILFSKISNSRSQENETNVKVILLSIAWFQAMLLGLLKKCHMVHVGSSKSSAFLEDPAWVLQQFGESEQHRFQEQCILGE